MPIILFIIVRKVGFWIGHCLNVQTKKKKEQWKSPKMSVKTVEGFDILENHSYTQNNLCKEAQYSIVFVIIISNSPEHELRCFKNNRCSTCWSVTGESMLKSQHSSTEINCVAEMRSQSTWSNCLAMHPARTRAMAITFKEIITKNIIKSGTEKTLLARRGCGCVSPSRCRE